MDYWAVPAGDETAAAGRWEKGPGLALFEAIEAELGDLPIIAEDLGFMTSEVQELRARLGFPGMKILQFAFEPEGDNADYPYNYERNAVVYTGTHDNNTCMGWIGEAAPAAARRGLGFVGGRRAAFAWNMIKAALGQPRLHRHHAGPGPARLGKRGAHELSGQAGWLLDLADG